MRKVHIKKIIIIFILVLIAVVYVRNIWIANTAEQFCVMGNTPYILRDGKLYKYTAGGFWCKVKTSGIPIKLETGESLCYLDQEGKVYYDTELNYEEEYLPLSAAFGQYMTDKLLQLNQEVVFLAINENIGMENARALLTDGNILYSRMDQWEVFESGEKIAALSGYFILTASGNVYLFDVTGDGDGKTVFKCIYEQSDIVKIKGAENAWRCLGLKEDGTVVSYNNDGNALPVETWKNVSDIEIGSYYGLALTEDGRVLYTDSNAVRSQLVNEKLEKWSGIIAIEAYYDKIIGLKNNGRCITLELSALE